MSQPKHMFALDLTYWSLLLFATVFLPIGHLHAAEKAKAKLIVSDVLTMPGKAVKLEAHVFEEGLLGRRIGLGGETLEFLIQDKVVGTTMTGGDGRAYLEVAPRMRGNLAITVRLKESSRVLSAEGTGLLASWERRKPILLIDVIAIVQQKDKPPLQLPSLPIHVSSQQLGEAEADAAGELEKLGKFYYNLIYLYRSPAGDVEMLQEWIRAKQFPPGFPIVIPNGHQALMDLIMQLKEQGWEHITGGIGRTVEFAQALVENRLKAVIVHDPDEREGFPRRAVLVNSWKRVRKHL